MCCNTYLCACADGPKDPTLDRFFAQHTSEDNASFQELMKLCQERLRKAKPWLFKDHNPPKNPYSNQDPQSQLMLTDGSAQPKHQSSRLPPQPQLLLTDTSAQAQQQSAVRASEPAQGVASSSSAVPAEMPLASTTSAVQVVPHEHNTVAIIKDADRAVQRPRAPTDGYGTTGQESQTLDSWPHVNKSALYYDSSQREVVPWTEAELADMVQGPPKQIKHSATRFPSDFDSKQQTNKVCVRSQQNPDTALSLPAFCHACCTAQSTV